ncbi:hypothetical protein ACFLYU_00130 [Candidatus Dependentiae bacterium]
MKRQKVKLKVRQRQGQIKVVKGHEKMQKFICSKLLVAFAINLLVVPFANCGRGSFKHKKVGRGKSFLVGNKFKNKLRKQDRKRKNKKNQLKRFDSWGSQRLGIRLPRKMKYLWSLFLVAFCAKMAYMQNVEACDGSFWDKCMVDYINWPPIVTDVCRNCLAGDPKYCLVWGFPDAIPCNNIGCDGELYDFCDKEKDNLQTCCYCEGELYKSENGFIKGYACTGYLTCPIINCEYFRSPSSICTSMKKSMLDSGVQLEGQTVCYKSNATNSDCCHFMKSEDTSACERSAGYSLANMGISPVLSFIAPFVAFFLYKYFPKMCKKKNKNNDAITYEEEKKLTQEQRRELREGKKLEKKSRPELETQSKRALRQAQDETTETETESETETGTD